MGASSYRVKNVLITFTSSSRSRMLFRAEDGKIYLTDAIAGAGDNVALADGIPAGDSATFKPATIISPAPQALNIAEGRYYELKNEYRISKQERFEWTGIAVFNPRNKSLLIEEAIGFSKEIGKSPTSQDPIDIYTPRIRISRYSGKALFGLEQRYNINFNNDAGIGDVVITALGADLYVTASDSLYWSTTEQTIGSSPDRQATPLSTNSKIVLPLVAAHNLLKKAGGALASRAVDLNQDGTLDTQFAFPIYRASGSNKPIFSSLQLYDLVNGKTTLKPRTLSKAADIVDQEILFEADFNGDKVIGERSVILRPSQGQVLTTGDWAIVRYQGNLVDAKGKTGAQFDANYNFATFTDIPGREPFQVQLGANRVIQGWEQGLLNRRVGEVVELTIPPELAYGDRTLPNIPANSVLRFKIEIVGAIKSSAFSPDSILQFSRASLQDLGLPESLSKSISNDLIGYNPSKGIGESNISATKVGLSDGDILIGQDLASTTAPTASKRDLIIGLAGDDRITGCLGGDFLIGGEGHNTYIYTSVNESLAQGTSSDLARTSGFDWIYGFSPSDKIDLSAIPQDLSFSTKSTFSGVAGDVFFTPLGSNQRGGFLIVDIDGNKQPDMAVYLVNNTSITASQLIL